MLLYLIISCSFEYLYLWRPLRIWLRTYLQGILRPYRPSTKKLFISSACCKINDMTPLFGHLSWLLFSRSWMVIEALPYLARSFSPGNQENAIFLFFCLDCYPQTIDDSYIHECIIGMCVFLRLLLVLVGYLLIIKFIDWLAMHFIVAVCYQTDSGCTRPTQRHQIPAAMGILSLNK